MLQNTCPVEAPQILPTSSGDNKRAPRRLNTLSFILGSFQVISSSLFLAQTYSPGLSYLWHLSAGSGFHTETSELVTPEDQSGLAGDHGTADRRNG